MPRTKRRKAACPRGRLGTPGYGRKIQKRKELIDRPETHTIDKLNTRKRKPGRLNKAEYSKEEKIVHIHFNPSKSRRFTDPRTTWYELKGWSPQRWAAFKRSPNKTKKFWDYRDPGKRCKRGWKPQVRFRSSTP